MPVDEKVADLTVRGDACLITTGLQIIVIDSVGKVGGRLVLSVVQRFGGRGENPDDLFQIGCVGLIKAIDNFDPSLNVQFSTYRSSNGNTEKLEDI